MPEGDPILVPLALRAKTAGAEVDARDEDGARVALLPDAWATEIAVAGLLALARVAGADPGDDFLRRLVTRVVDGAPGPAHIALGQLALGRSEELRRVWAHQPFRDAARTLADHRMLMVALGEGDRPRTLTYAHDDHPAAAQPDAGDGLLDRLADWLGWDGRDVRVALPHLHDSGSHEFEFDAGGAEPTVEIDDRAGAADVRITAAAAHSVLWGPVAGLLAAVLLTIGWLAAPGFEGKSSPLLVLLGVPAVLAAYLGRRPDPAAPLELVRGVRTLLLGVAAVSLLAEAALASGASAPVLRIVCGVLSLFAWVLAALLVETRRRALGGMALSLAPRGTARGPERDSRRPHATRTALLACAMAGGLMVVALADVAARDGSGAAHGLFWIGLLAIYVPAVLHAWSAPPRTEAVIGVVLLGAALYLVKVLHSPLHFTFHDEFSTLRTTVDIERSGALFESNPLIEVHPFYPALELVTSALSSVTGLSLFVSGLVVIGLLRVALMAGLFLAFESAVSTRIAGLATVLYACNPNFVFFDSQWAYESFALPLALVAVAMAAQGRRTALLAIPIVITLCMSHPLTSIALILFLVVWAGFDRWTAARPDGTPRNELWILAGSGALFLTLWALLVARSLGGYLGPVLGDAGESLVDLLLGESGPKRIFGAAGVSDTPILERALGFAAVLLALAAVGLGVRAVWRRYSPLAAALAVAALAYPLSLPLRLTEAGTEISNRASEFVFVGVALLGAVVLYERRFARFATPVVLAAAAVGADGRRGDRHRAARAAPGRVPRGGGRELRGARGAAGGGLGAPGARA